MKRLIAISFVLSLFLLLPACAASNQPVTDIKALEEQVFADYIEEFYPGQYPHQKPSEFDAFRYYGTDNGYHIILLRPAGVHTAESYVNDIAGYPFDLGAGLQLKAYKNGKFIDLQEAYEKGIISEESIAKAAELHAERKNATD